MTVEQLIKTLAQCPLQAEVLVETFSDVDNNAMYNVPIIQRVNTNSHPKGSIVLIAAGKYFPNTALADFREDL